LRQGKDGPRYPWRALLPVVSHPGRWFNGPVLHGSPSGGEGGRGRRGMPSSPHLVTLPMIQSQGVEEKSDDRHRAEDNRPQSSSVVSTIAGGIPARTQQGFPAPGRRDIQRISRPDASVWALLGRKPGRRTGSWRLMAAIGRDRARKEGARRTEAGHIQLTVRHQQARCLPDTPGS
jgi:hypothetical protein